MSTHVPFAWRQHEPGKAGYCLYEDVLDEMVAEGGGPEARAYLPSIGGRSGLRRDDEHWRSSPHSNVAQRIGKGAWADTRSDEALIQDSRPRRDDADGGSPVPLSLTLQRRLHVPC